MPSKPQLILASASERRSHLLNQMQLSFLIQPACLNEDRQLNETPAEYVQRLALQKAQSVWQTSDRVLPVLGADTIVCLDSQTLGKPDDYDHAVAMLLSLANREHEVLTSISVVTALGQRSCTVSSQVEFMSLSKAQCEAYCQTGEPMDKAGAYAIQGLAGIFVRRLSGSYSAVVGLPLFETAELLSAAGVQIPMYTHAS